MNGATEKFTQPMIFVTGASRSGTTMLSRMLGKHSSVAGLRELHCFGDLYDAGKLGEHIERNQAVRLSAQLIARSMRDVWGNLLDQDRVEAEKLWHSVPDGTLQAGQVIATTLAHLAEKLGKVIPCEQTPRNIFYAADLLESYPNLKMVHLARDPRDVLASQKNRWKRKRLGGSNIPYSEIVRVWFNYHPYTISKLWVKANRLALQLAGHPRFRLVRFEDIVARPQIELEKLCNFLELPFEPGMLDVPQVGSSHRSNADQTLGVTSSSVNRWVETLSSGEVFVCERLAGPLMDELSYPRGTNDSHIDPSVLAQILKYPVHAAGVLATNPRRAWIQFQAILGKSK